MTPKEYLKKCRDYGELMGYAPNNYPAIKKAEHPTEWRLWRAWYRSHDFLASLDLMSGDKREKTVPALNPSDFDPGWLPSQKDFDPPPYERPGPEARARMQDYLRDHGLRYMQDGVVVDPERQKRAEVSQEMFERSNVRWDNCKYIQPQGREPTEEMKLAQARSKMDLPPKVPVREKYGMTDEKLAEVPDAPPRSEKDDLPW